VVVRVQGDIFAFENSCPHQHFSLLHQGTLDRCTITCPMHGWTFEMRTGVSTNGNGRLTKAAVRVENGTVWIKAGEPGPSFAMFDS
ncbi:MAG TPA: Rieske 2Fe-2S domain-containing protein, partial [Bacteroidota bacterium]|nr:Rieske 2Fe-2S domain-containing protein [Bacteroidota bacterium]